MINFVSYHSYKRVWSFRSAINLAFEQWFDLLLITIITKCLKQCLLLNINHYNNILIKGTYSYSNVPSFIYGVTIVKYVILLSYGFIR